MSLFTFKKGLHLPYNKEFSKNKFIEYVAPEGELIFTLSQHIGTPCESLVNVGDKVLVNQKIGDSKGFVSAPIHSSISGVVSEIKDINSFNGGKVKAIIVKNDFKYESITIKETPFDFENSSLKDLCSLVKESGIVGLGGATFPCHVKLSIPDDKEINYIIINAAECEPYLTCDHRVMLEHTKEIVTALKILLKFFPKAKVYIGIEDNKPDAITSFNNILNNDSKIKVIPLETKYPQGSEKHLIYAITKLEVPSGKLPLDVGCVVHNISTIYQLYQSLVLNLPLTERVLTVTGDAINSPKNIRVKIGTPLKDVVRYCGGFRIPPSKIILGGPMMGFAINSLEFPVTKGTSGIICLSEADNSNETHCIRCGKCIDACPMNLLPQKLNELSNKTKFDEFKKSNGMDCIECGCCAFSCPAKIPLVKNFRKAKTSLRNNFKK